jgi:DNA-binding beta-propeller fold protein YncE
VFTRMGLPCLAEAFSEGGSPHQFTPISGAHHPAAGHAGTALRLHMLRCWPGATHRERSLASTGALVFALVVATVLWPGGNVSAQGQDLFVADKTADFHDRLLRYSSTGAFLGDLGVGAPLSGPVGLAVDRAGNLYVANMDDSKILRYSGSGSYLGIFASTGLYRPAGIAFDSDGTLVACNHDDGSVSRYSASGQLLSHVPTGLTGLLAIALDKNGNIYVSMSNTGPGTGVFRLAADGTGRTLFASGPTLDARGLAFDSMGRLNVVNCLDDSVRRFDLDGTDLGVFASGGLNNPFAIAFDAAGDLYVSNQTGGTIRRFSATGTDLGDFAVVTGFPANPVGLAFSVIPEPGLVSLLALGACVCRSLRAWQRRG